MAGEIMACLSFSQGDLVPSFLVFALYAIKRKKAEISVM